MKTEELAHYGVLGMKWGVRRTPEQLARARRKTKSSTKTKLAPKKETSTAKRKSASEMSDDELNKAIRRLQLEKQYNDLNPKTVSAGKKFVNTVMSQVITPAAIEVGKQMTKEYMTELAKSLRKRK